MHPVESFSKALLSLHGDEQALAGLVVEHRAAVAPWIARAERDLRSTLARQDVARVRELGTLVAAVLCAQGDEAQFRSFREALNDLLVALEASQQGDVQTALQLCEWIARGSDFGLSLRWAGQLGVGLAQAQLGDAAGGEAALLEARHRAQELDPLAQALTDCHLVELEARLGQALARRLESALARLELDQGRLEAARERLAQARAVFEAEGDRGGLAMAWLVEARLLSAEELKAEELYENRASVAAAQRAAMADPRWPQPALFLARTAMINGDLDEAEQRLRSIPPSDLVRTWLGLVARARRAAIPPWIAAEYMALHGQPASRALVEQYEVLIGLNPELLRLREAIAWTLLQLGEVDAAERQLQELLRESLDADLHAATVAALAAVEFARHAADAQARDRLGALDRWAIDCSGRRCPAFAAAKSGLGLREPRDDVADESAQATRPTAETPVLPAALLAAARAPTTEHPAARSSAGLPAITEFAGHERTQDDPAVFSGDLATLNVLQLLEFFRTTKRTGALLVNADCGSGVLRLSGGRLLAARATGCSSLTELLLAEGRVTSEQLETARAQPSTASRGTVGSTLLALGFVAEPVLTEVLNRQLRQAVRAMMQWNKGRFAFRPHVEWVLRVEGHTAIDTQEVLFDLALDLPDAE